MKKALFLRLDRMGDLILTLPCDQLVTGEYQVHWVIPQGLDFVVRHATPKRHYSSFSGQYSLRNFLSFYKHIQSIKADVSLSFHVPWWVNAALFLARIPTRGGVLSQWHSYLFLNKGLRQKRSRCEAHEMEYNFQLTEHVFDLTPQKQLHQPLSLQVSDHLSPLDYNTPYYVVHPGMGGSALNWPTSHYKQLIEELSQKTTVVITGTQMDEAFLTPLKKALADNHSVIWLDKKLSGDQLLSVLQNAIAIIAPSTGVLHLGASLGATSLGIYSPIQVHHPDRWGPKGACTEVFIPQVICPAQFECLGESCTHYPCMNQLSPLPIIRRAKQACP